MKTLGYQDIQGGPIYTFSLPSDRQPHNLFQSKRMARLTAAIEELKSLGRVYLYLVDGRKARRIAYRGW